MNHFQKFSKSLRRLKLQPTSTVAVAVSGGCDSIALTLLAKKFFNKVIGITIDKSSQEESRHAVAKVGDLVKRFGVEHHTVHLDYRPAIRNKIKWQKMVKRDSYDALVNTCEQLGIKTLLIGHHLDDLSAVFLSNIRHSLDSGMYPVSYWPGYPATKIVRPLLEWSKKEVVEMCRSEGVEVCESEGAESISFDWYMKRIWSEVLKHEPDITDDLPQLAKSLYEVRLAIQQKVSETIDKLAVIDTNMGCLSMDTSKFKSHPLSIQMGVLHTLASYIAGSVLKTSHNVLHRICKTLPLSKAEGLDLAVLTQEGKELSIRKTRPANAEPVPISVGKPFLWDGRWLITLYPLSDSEEEQDGKSFESHSFSVGPLMNKDWSLGHFQGVRRVRKAAFPHTSLRPSLPVVRDEKDNVVFIPHLEVMDRSYGLSCRILYQPSLSMKKILKTSLYV